MLTLALRNDFGPIEAFSFGSPIAEGGDFVVQASLRQIGFQGGSGLVLKRRSQAPELIYQDFTQILPGQAAPADALDGAREPLSSGWR